MTTSALEIEFKCLLLGSAGKEKNFIKKNRYSSAAKHFCFSFICIRLCANVCSAVGKTCLANRYVFGNFLSNTSATVGASFMSKRLCVLVNAFNCISNTSIELLVICM